MRAKPWDVPDGLWERIEPLLPRRERRFRYPGRKPFDDRLALQGILFVLAHRDRLGASAAGARLRLRDDGLATAALSGSSDSRCRSSATTRLAIWSSIGAPRKMIRSLSRRE